MKKIVVTGVAAFALAACSTATDTNSDTATRSLTGLAPAGTEQLLVIDADGTAFTATPAADRSFRVAIASQRPVSVFVVGNGETRVLRVAPAPGEAPSQTILPLWRGEANTDELIAGDANEDGIDEEVTATENPLEAVDSDDDGTSDFDDSDDDGDGTDDAEDGDRDGDGRDDDGDDLDSDDDQRPDLCDDDDDNDGVRDEDDEDEADDHDGDGVRDDDDADDDNDAEGDDRDSDDDNDGVSDDEDEGEGHDGEGDEGEGDEGEGDDEDPAEGEGEDDEDPAEGEGESDADPAEGEGEA